MYILTSPDYGVYMDIQQATNVALSSRFGDESIGFAYPTRTVHIARAGGPPHVAPAAPAQAGQAAAA